MRVRLTIPVGEVEKLEGRIKESAEVVEDTEARDNLWETVSFLLRFIHHIN